MRGWEEIHTPSPIIPEAERLPREEGVGEQEGGSHLGGIWMTLANQATSLGLMAFIFFFLIFGCIRSQLWHERDLPCGAWASLQLWPEGFLFFSCGMQAPGLMGSVVVAHRFQSAGALQFAARGLQLRHASSVVVAQLPRSMWDLSSLTRD